MGRKIKFYGILCAMVILLSTAGMFIGMLLVEFEKRRPQYFSNTYVQTFILAIVGMHIAALIHEIAHIIVFKAKKYKLSIFIFSFLFFYKKDGKYLVKFNKNALFYFGGLIIPTTPFIKKEEEFKKLRRDFALAIIIGPLVSIIIGLCSLYLGINVTDKINANFQSTFFTLYMFISVASLNIILSSFIKLGGIVGDWRAYKLYKNNDLFALNQFMEDYYTFEDFKGDIWDSEPLNRLLGSYDIQEIADNSIFVSLFEKVLYFSLANERELPKTASDYLEFYVENLEILRERLKYENYALFFFRLILYISIRDNEKSVEVWEKYKDELSENEVNKYHIVQVESTLYKKNNIEELSNIKISSADNICWALDGYYEYEQKINELIINM